MFKRPSAFDFPYLLFSQWPSTVDRYPHFSLQVMKFKWYVCCPTFGYCMPGTVLDTLQTSTYFAGKTPKWGPVTGLPHRGGESAVDRSGDFPRSRTSLCWGAGCWGCALNYSFAFSPPEHEGCWEFPNKCSLRPAGP